MGSFRQPSRHRHFFGVDLSPLNNPGSFPTGFLAAIAKELDVSAVPRACPYRELSAFVVEGAGFAVFATL